MLYCSLCAAADLSSAITDFDYGLQCIQQAQELFQQLGNQRGEIDARLRYCNLAGFAGKDTNIQAQAEEALRMAEQISYIFGIAKARQVLGSIAYDSDMPEAAIQYHLPNLALWRELDSPLELATAFINLGVALLEIGEYVAGRQAFEECRDIYQSLNYQRGVALAVHDLGETAYKMGEYGKKIAYLLNNQSEIQTTGEAGRAWVVKYHDYCQVADKLVAIYRSN